MGYAVTVRNNFPTVNTLSCGKLALLTINAYRQMGYAVIMRNILGLECSSKLTKMVRLKPSHEKGDSMEPTKKEYRAQLNFLNDGETTKLTITSSSQRDLQAVIHKQVNGKVRFQDTPNSDSGTVLIFEGNTRIGWMHSYEAPEEFSVVRQTAARKPQQVAA